MSGAVIAWRNYVDLPALGSPWTLDDAETYPGVDGSTENLLSPIRRRLWVGPGGAVDGGDNSLQFAWATTSGNSRSIRLLGMCDAEFVIGGSAALRYISSSGVDTLAQNYTTQANFYDSEPRHWFYPLSAAVNARGIKVTWNNGAADTVSGSRLWASDAVVLSCGVSAEQISDEWSVVGDDLVTVGNTLTRDSTARVLRRLRVTIDGPDVTRSVMYGDGSDPDAPFLADLCGRGIGSDIVIIPNTTVDTPTTRRRLIYGTITSSVRVTPRSGGLFALRFDVQEI